MSYSSAQRNEAIITIGEYGTANITSELYDDLEKFNLLRIIRENDVIAGATLTFAGNEFFTRLKKTEEYNAIIKNDFFQVFNGIIFKFHPDHDIEQRIIYRVGFNNNGTRKYFNMYQYDGFVWKIEKITLPPWVLEMEMEFSTAILNHAEILKL